MPTVAVTIRSLRLFHLLHREESGRKRERGREERAGERNWWKTRERRKEKKSSE